MQIRLIFCIKIILIIGLNFPSVGQIDHEKSRLEMVEKQIEGRGIKDKNTLNSMRLVERHLFVPNTYKSNAYEDRPLPIGYGQTISQPYIVAYMTELLNVMEGHTVLEIGTGSGYQAAVLSKIVKQVYTIEIVDELGKEAKERLKTLGYKNVEVKIADGFYGWQEKGPYDGIIVTAASEYIPPSLIEQLKDGGRMIIPVGSPFSVQTLMLITKNGKKITSDNLIPVRFVPFVRKK